MSVSIDTFARELRAFDQRKEIVKQLRKEMRAPVPAVRKKIKQRALNTLPKRGGLNVWASRTKVTARIKVTSRTVAVTMSGTRRSEGGISDLRRLDQGRVRHPSWGRRGRGQWRVQRVTEGFFTDPCTEMDQWQAACLTAVDRALETIRG